MPSSKKAEVGHSKSLLSLSLFAALIGLAYMNSVGNEFVYDDRGLILQNAQIRDLKNIPHFFTSHYWGNVQDPNGDILPMENSYHYRPLVLTSYALNYSIHGYNPMGYHLVNMVIHLLVVWLLYQIALRLSLSWEASVLIAAIFAVHSLHSEDVTGLSGRAELLMSIGVLGSLWLTTTRFRWLAFIVLPIGLLSKEQAVMFPAILVLWNWCSLPHSQSSSKSSATTEWKKAMSYYGPFVLLVAGYLLIRNLVVGNVGIPQPQFLENPLAHVDWWSRTMTAIKIAGKYLTLWLWPSELSADYSYNAIPISHSILSLEVLWGILLWTILVGLGLWGWTRDRRVTFGVGLTLITFFPVSNMILPIGTIMAERVFYLPSVGLCILVGIGWDYINQWAEQKKSNKYSQKKRSDLKGNWYYWYRLGMGTLAVCIISGLTVRTAIRNTDWATEIDLFSSVISIVPNDAKAYVFLADEYAIHGQHSQAREAYTKALSIYPGLSSTNVLFNNNYGSLLVREGKITEAIQRYEEAVKLNPQLSTIQHNLALAYALGGQPQKATGKFLEAIKLNPGVAKFHVSFSVFLTNQGESSWALEEANRALTINPKFALAYYARGVAFEQQGEKEAAIQNYQEALARDPNLQPAQERLSLKTP